MFDELFRDHTCGGFHAGGEGLVLGAEEAATTDRLSHTSDVTAVSALSASRVTRAKASRAIGG